MNKQQAMALQPGDKIRAANGRTGEVFLHIRKAKKLVIRWDDGEHQTYIRPYRAAWMIEQVSCAIQREV